MYRERSILVIVCVFCMFQVLVKPCWYCWFQFLLPHNQVGTPTWTHRLVLFLIIITLIIFHHTNFCGALLVIFAEYYPLLFWIVVSLKVFQPVKACVAVKLLNLVVVIPYLRYFPKNVIYLHTWDALLKMRNAIANMKNNLLFLVSNCLKSTIWCFEGMQRIYRGIFRGHQDHTRSPVMMIRWSKRWWHIYDLFSSPNPLLIIPTAKPIVKRLLLRDICVCRFFCFWLSHFLARFAISYYLSVWIWFLQQFIHET